MTIDFSMVQKWCRINLLSWKRVLVPGLIFWCGECLMLRDRGAQDLTAREESLKVKDAPLLSQHAGCVV